MSTTIDYDASRQALRDERLKLVHRLEELGATEDGQLRHDREFADSFADAGAATAERTEVLGMVETIRQQLDEVDAALGRLEAGTYGVCESCGETISPARLEARPASRYCVACKSRR
ncbi:MAG: TraR/DksA C4-type zinc finger protein [Actinomycetota bacterium]|nr:TraR/DksA C4-type zinc finger protein [Actinomycetota bacterium]